MDEKQQIQERYYSDLARDYDQKFHRENANHLCKIREIGRSFASHFGARNDLKILEIGAGTGIHAFHLLREQHLQISKLVLTDLSPAMLAQAMVRLTGFPQVEYVCSAAEQLSVNQSFDGIYVSGAMHHFSNPRAAIVDAYRHLKADGMLVVCEPIVWNPLNFIQAAIRKEEWGQFSVTRRNVRRFVKEAGYRILGDRVLHWNGESSLSEKLWPAGKLEKFSALDVLAVMFLISAVKSTHQSHQ
jgi:ubiquinone/menaquinone biosynthesis C-methylase UbiE